MNILGVISDTHGLLRDEATDLLHGVHHIIHAGDIGHPAILEQLAAIAPVSAIRGNIDRQPWAASLPETLFLSLFGTQTFIIHDRKDLTFSPSEKGVRLIISGHSHRAGHETLHNVLYLNPGSAGPRRFRLPVTMAKVEITNGDLVPTFYTLS